MIDFNNNKKANSPALAVSILSLMTALLFIVISLMSSSAFADKNYNSVAQPDCSASEKVGRWFQPEDTKGNYQVTILDTATSYRDRTGNARRVDIRVYYPCTEKRLSAPLIILSHGGSGNPNGKAQFSFHAKEYASHGYVAAVLSHRPSRGGVPDHIFERPTDVSKAIDHLAAITLPQHINIDIQFDNVGHFGHSFGAYTSHAVAGADFLQGNFRDQRIRAIAPLSPQGADRFGSFDESARLTSQSDSNSWAWVTIPAFNVVGRLEKDSAANGEFIQRNWRLYPFYRYERRANKYLVVIPEAGHTDLGSRGPQYIQNFVAENTRVFFDVYLKGRTRLEKEIGTKFSIAGADTVRGN